MNPSHTVLKIVGTCDSVDTKNFVELPMLGEQSCIDVIDLAPLQPRLPLSMSSTSPTTIHIRKRSESMELT
jgi:hypothetical protein